MNDLRQEVLHTATILFGRNPDWVTFFRQVLGPEGIARKAFPEAEPFAQFERSDEYQQIQTMVSKLREKNPDPNGEDKEPTRVITVRLPKCVHEALKLEAHDRRTSMNQLCISKLLKIIEEGGNQEATPAELAASEQ